MTSSESAYSSYVTRRHKDGMKRELTDINRINAREISVGGRVYVNACSNDYLGLSQHPELKERAKLWTDASGVGSGASRLVTGNLDYFSTIEEKVAAAKGKEAALVLASGFQTNVSVLGALLDSRVFGAEPLVYADKLNHASMHLGCQVAGVRQIRYRHRDAKHLAQLLERDRGEVRPRFILTESIFSMDGDLAPLEEISALAKQYEAMLIVDDAHGAGVFGPHGAGLGAQADLVIGTFSKAYGAFGAYVACSTGVRDYLVNNCSGLIYSTALPPSVLGAIDAALDVVPSLDVERDVVLGLAAKFRDGAKAIGFDVGQSISQIVPIILGDATLTVGLSEHLRDRGFWVTSIRPPTVPKGSARLRFAFSAAHRNEDVDQLLALLKDTAR